MIMIQANNIIISIDTNNIMDDLISTFKNTSLTPKESNDLINYINVLDIDVGIKENLRYLIQNDNHCDYLTIYNICMENDIELPPIQ
jgi:hypothetical protein